MQAYSQALSSISQSNLAESMSQILLIVGLFMIHMVPEISGFLIAAIAGGVMSKSDNEGEVDRESLQDVFKDALMLLLIACLLILVAASLRSM